MIDNRLHYDDVINCLDEKVQQHLKEKLFLRDRDADLLTRWLTIKNLEQISEDLKSIRSVLNKMSKENKA